MLADTDALLPTRVTREIVLLLLPDNDEPLRFIRVTRDVVFQHVPLDTDAPWVHTHFAREIWVGV